MNLLNFPKVVFFMIVSLCKQVGALPESIANFFKQRRAAVARAAFEVERLDRIRNPSKYLGK